jgi:phenylalanyl-tRNA synthetase beta chain
MKISYKWLRDYVDVDLSPEQVSEILSNTGLEVEGLEKIETVKGGLQGIVVGEVIECDKHPNADKLSVTKVDIGSGALLSIVCGAPNVAKGQKVPVATIGTTLYSKDDSFQIKKTKLRGELSEGMICAEDELGLGKNHEGIMVLDKSIKPGTPLMEIIKVEEDYVFEIGLTPNRIDGASHFGAARDLAAFINLNKKTIAALPDISSFKPDNTKVYIDIEIEDNKLCTRYSGLTISGVQVSESPEWLQNKIRAIGLTPINNVVDITNFVLFETGQPLHAFDLAKVSGNKVVVKTLAEGTKFKTLDEVERVLGPDDIMICNESEPMCIAGVFGGIDSGVTNKTTDIFLESACFNPVYIRKTSKKHLLNTDASFRFERGTDPEGTLYALKRTAILIKDIAKGTISSEVYDMYPEVVEKKKIHLSVNNINSLIGKVLDKNVILKILNSLDFVIENDEGDSITVLAPTYRIDVTRQADVIEEIIRIYGFNNIDLDNSLTISLSAAEKPDKEFIKNEVSNLLSANGFNEIMCNSLTKADYYKDSEGENSLVFLENPLSNDLGVMRQSLLFGCLETLQYNKNRQNPNLKVYEFGNTYFKASEMTGDVSKDYVQTTQLALMISGKKNVATWSAKEEKSSFFELKAYMNIVFERLGFNMYSLKTKESEWEFFEGGLSYFIKKKKLAEIGIVKNDIIKGFDIDESVFFASIDWDAVLDASKHNTTQFEELPKFPEVDRDLSLLINKEVKFEDIVSIAKNTIQDKLVSVTLFDVFEDAQKLGADKKSYAVNFVFLDKEKTMNDKQIEGMMNKLISGIKKETGAVIR